MASVRASFLRDVTSSANKDSSTSMKSTDFWGTALQATNGNIDATPLSRKGVMRGSTFTPTPYSPGSAGGMTDSPMSASVRHSATPRVAKTLQQQIPTYITPSKVLFQQSAARSSAQQQYLLKDVDRKPHLTVVFDLDETLVSNRRADLAQAILRPYALHVLNALRHMPNLEVVMWTASTRETGTPVVEQLYEGGSVFDDIIYRNDAWFTEPIHTKDLRLLGRDMNRVVIFDNAPNCCKLNPQNSVMVEDFHGNRAENDAALVNCYYIIESLLKQCAAGVAVKDGLSKLLSEGHLCRPIYYQLPEGWSKVDLNSVQPIKIPPHGKYVRAHTLPPNAQTMKHWTM